MSRHVFLSPHFDDAVFSCGGTIAQLVRAGHEVAIVTVMGGHLPAQVPDTPIVRDLHQRWQAGSDPIPARQQEDIAAIRRLGAHVVQLDVPDCVYRMADGRALYPDEQALWGSVHAQDRLDAYLDRTAAATLILGGTSTLYVPLAVGNHVDHQLVRQWGLQLAASGVALQFYTDFPYMKDSSRISRALNHVQEPVHPRWVYLNADELSLKMEAMACYASQISTFWRNTDHMRQDVVDSFRVQHDLWGERYWLRAGSP